MKRSMMSAFLVAASSMISGCATPYLVDRRRDAADIVTVTAGMGGGAKARVGPVQVGFWGCHDIVGLRGGTVGFWGYEFPPTDHWRSRGTPVGEIVDIEGNIIGVMSDKSSAAVRQVGTDDLPL
jgi:hypothetical protein